MAGFLHLAHRYGLETTTRGVTRRWVATRAVAAAEDRVDGENLLPCRAIRWDIMRRRVSCRGARPLQHGGEAWHCRVALGGGGGADGGDAANLGS